MDAILFYLMAALTVGCGLAVVLNNNPVGAAISLVGAFVGVALLYVALAAHFVAVMQLLLYAGAIMVFFVFVIMLLNLQPKAGSWKTVTGTRLIGFGAGAYLLAVFGMVARHLWSTAAANEVIVEGTVERVGTLLFSQYVVPFELTSVVLFVALIGAVLMGKRSV